MPTVLRRLILWTVICCVSAAPSFVFAAGDFHRGAMVAGVCLFIAAYTAATSTRAFERFHRRPFVRRTLYIGYGLRLFLSLLMPVGHVTVPVRMVMFADLWPGMLSVLFVQRFFTDPESFAGTLLTTIVQGTLLNAIIFLVMAVVYGFQRLFLTPPTDAGPHGFDVVMPVPATPAERVVR